jgi:lipoic acid synthetase
MESVIARVQPSPRPRFPAWIRTKVAGGDRYTQLRDSKRQFNLHTVCEEARCPNIGECWSHGTATFMLMGDVCTRRCNFCSVDKGRPGALDASEPEHIAEVVAAMNLDYCVLTSVNRDDLPDQGSGHIAATIEAVHQRLPACKLEMLIPDFRGDAGCIRTVVETPLTVLAHNLETVPRLTKDVRNGAQYDRSLTVLSIAKQTRPGILTKSGLMLGFGETREELLEVFRDLRRHHCDILTLGQYLQPSPEHLPVTAFITPAEFADLREDALSLGFRHVESGPMVRSSYHAWEHIR